MFRNLDLDRTIWKNLTNWSPEEERLYVDRLYYRQTARKTLPQRLIVVVDQSGSMTNSMVNCTILASIFAGLPKVDVHLIAYDTQALDLTPGRTTRSRRCCAPSWAAATTAWWPWR